MIMKILDKLFRKKRVLLMLFNTLKSILSKP